MATYFHKLSSFLFYVVGLSFFAAYLMHYNKIGVVGTWWLKIADLPFALLAIIYGGTSLYLSVKPSGKDSKGLAYTIGIPLTAVFLFLVTLNFWELV